MTVKQLISKLKKMPQNAVVGIQDHDADTYTISSWLSNVYEINFDEIPDNLMAENIWKCTGIVVSLKA